MNELDPRRWLLAAAHPSTVASMRAALTRSLISPSDDGAAELFRAASAAARRERVSPAHLIEIIESIWSEVADATHVPPAERADLLAVVLTHAIAWVLNDANPQGSA